MVLPTRLVASPGGGGGEGVLGLPLRMPLPGLPQIHFLAFDQFASPKLGFVPPANINNHGASTAYDFPF